MMTKLKTKYKTKIIVFSAVALLCLATLMALTAYTVLSSPLAFGRFELILGVSMSVLTLVGILAAIWATHLDTKLDGLKKSEG